MLNMLSQWFHDRRANTVARREQRAEEARIEFDFARQMRARSEPGSVEFVYYNAIVRAFMTN